ncbi:hypothetical protein BDK89_4172 [Ilumatobacter fluminis]|uniref:Uncharacterized protein n=1 Tax=Ilumatobacter fluminis TaxID=467091 RepID=A0A4V3EJI4_9ACTN|nr:hypothetical protein [Ilumatobacter fluminis]TDT18548.1 hypothetical protein BDK89_4172 [Ilumatobacter fluminis]
MALTTSVRSLIAGSLGLVLAVPVAAGGTAPVPALDDAATWTQRGRPWR